MNPFQLHAEFARQWLGLSNAIVSAAMSTASTFSEQMASGWNRTLSGSVGQPQIPWPLNAWQVLAGSYAAPALPFTNQFFAPAAPTFWPFPAWMSAPPMAFAPPVMVTWAWPWGAQWPAAPWLAASSRPANLGTELVEQVAASYRTASGYAVAAIMGPFGTALDPRTFGEPWWQSALKGKLLN